MSLIKSRSHVWPFLAILGLWVFLGQGQEAVANSNYNGVWEAIENNEGRILQQHNHVLTFSLEQSLTDILNSRENVNYNYRWQQEVGTQESVSPGASLSMNSDLFFASLAANSVKNLNSQSLMADSESVGVNWTSRWEKKFVPALRFNYDKSKSNLDTGERKNDEARQSYGGEVDWNLRLFQTVYSYRRDESQYLSYDMNQDSHMARVSADRAFMDDRLRVSMGHEYNESRNEQLINFNSGPSTYVGLTLPPGLYTGIGNDPDLLLTNNEGPLVLNGAMIDSNMSLTAYVIPVGLNNSIRMQIPANEQVDRIYIYTQNNLGLNPAGLTWRLYSNADFVLNPWSPLVGFSINYDTTNQRFVIILPTAANTRYLKVVVDRNIVAPNIDLTEIQAEHHYIGTPGGTQSNVTKSKSNKSNFGLDFKINSAVAFYYNYLKTKDESDSVITNEGENHNSGLHLQNSAGDLKSLLSYSLSRNRYADGPETKSQVYLLNINKVFLPTLSVALGGSHEETSSGGSSLSKRNRYNFYADTRLYPDLNSQLDVVYWDQESSRSGGVSILSDDLRTQFTLTSRFYPSLVVSLVEIYEIQNQDGKENINNNSIGLTGSWQLSDWFSVNASTQKNDSKFVDTVYSYSLGITVGFGAGLVLQGNYTLVEAAIRTQSGMAALRWSYHQNYSWEIGCNYAESGAEGLQNLYRVYSRMSVNFATH